MITLEDESTWPIPLSVWRHKNGNTYRVMVITNREQDRQDEYPTTVVYQNTKTSERYSRKLIDWERSMTRVSE